MLEIRELAGLARDREPLCRGVPLPRGWLGPGQPLRLRGEEDGCALPVQLAPLSYWPDGSIRWCLLDFQISLAPFGRISATLEREPCAPDEAPVVRVERRGDTWHVNTGAASFEVRSDLSPLPAQVRVAGEERLLRAGELTLVDGGGRTRAARLLRTDLEAAGPLRATLASEGRFSGRRGRLLRFICRLHFFAGHRLVRADLCLGNTGAARHSGGFWDLGDPGSFPVGDLSVRFAPTPAGGRPVLVSVDGGQSYAEAGADCSVYQDSSGGERWDSTNHAGPDGKPLPRFRGYRLQSAGRARSEAGRATPILRAGGAAGARVAATVQRFWQEFPTALEHRGGMLRAGLFPGERGVPHELQGGERKTRTVFLEFDGAENALRWVHQPLVPVLSREWVSRSGALPFLPERADVFDWEELIRGVVSGPSAFEARRETIDEYGWRNFGELYADHEAVRRAEPRPLVSHYNNQYDPLHGFLRQFLLRGDPRWFVLAHELARHVRDIDVYHTARDRAEYNHGMFWHTEHYQDAATCSHRSFSRHHTRSYGEQSFGGGPSPEHCYTRGLVLHHLLTGEPASRDTVLELAGWIRRVNREPSTLLGSLHLLIRNRRVLAAESRPEGLGPGRHPLTRASGNGIETLLDAFELTGERSWLEEAEGMIRGCAGPQDDIDRRDLLNAELRWSYTVCLQAVARYLEVKRERDEIDGMYAYARRTLLHYADWMERNEYHYLDRKDQLEFPTETWAAQDLRKARVLLAAALHAEPGRRERLARRGCAFFEESMERYRSFDTAGLTRPLALLLQNCELYQCFRAGPGGAVEPFPAPSADRPEAPGRRVPRGALGLVLDQLAHALRETSPAEELRWVRSRLRSRRR